MSEELKEGWGIPGQSKKWHYFRDGMSLCRKWGFFLGHLEPDEGANEDDCPACRKKLDKEIQSHKEADGE